MTGQSVLDLFESSEPFVKAPGPFMVYDHTTTNNRDAKSPHEWVKSGTCETLPEATTLADGRGTHAVVLCRGPIVYDNKKPVQNTE